MQPSAWEPGGCEGEGKGKEEESSGVQRGQCCLCSSRPAPQGTPVPWPLQEDTGHSPCHPPPGALVLAGDICNTKVLILESCRGLGML